MDVVPFLVAIARCYCRTANFGGVDVVPLLGAQCAMVGVGEANNQLWWSGAGHHSRLGEG